MAKVVGNEWVIFKQPLLVEAGQPWVVCERWWRWRRKLGRSGDQKACDSLGVRKKPVGQTHPEFSQRLVWQEEGAAAAPSTTTVPPPSSSPASSSSSLPELSRKSAQAPLNSLWTLTSWLIWLPGHELFGINWLSFNPLTTKKKKKNQGESEATLTWDNTRNQTL